MFVDNIDIYLYLSFWSLFLIIHICCDNYVVDYIFYNANYIINYIYLLFKLYLLVLHICYENYIL